MIDTVKTFERFGYRPSELGKWSKEKVVAICDNCGVERIIRNDSYRALCKSCGKLGRASPMKDKHHTEEANEKNRQKHLGKRPAIETEFKKGQTTWHKNKKGIYSKETLQKMSDAKKGKNPWNKNKTDIYSKETLEKMSKFRIGKFVGENAHNWKGGITTIYNRIRNLPEYKAWRTKVFERDNYTCQECGSTESGTLNVHHKKSFISLLNAFLTEYNQFSILEDIYTLVRLAINHRPFWDVSHSITLCVTCHEKEHIRLKLLKRVSK